MIIRSLLPIAVNKISTVCLLSLLGSKLIAQTNRDVQLRISPSLSYNINEKWGVGFTYRMSLDNDWSTFRSSYFLWDISYKIISGLTIEAAYVYTTSHLKDIHQPFLELGYKYRFNKRFQGKIALKYQFQTRDNTSVIRQDILDGQFLRLKPIVEFNVPKIKATICAGPEFIFKNSDHFSFNRMRYHISFEYEFKYGNNLELGCFYEVPLNRTKDQRIVYALKYKLKIHDLVKKIQKNKAKKALNNIQIK